MSQARMLTERVNTNQAWTAATIDEPSHWYFRVSNDAVTAFDRMIGEMRQHPREATQARLAEAEMAALTTELKPVAEALETGRGYSILQGLPLDRYSTQESQAVYWVLGEALGRPFAQNVQGTLLYDVKDTGQSVYSGARFSVTSAESTFHTDNSFGDEVLDYVGLLCLQAARSGGLNQVVSAYAAHNVLLETDRQALETLYQPFHVDRRGGTKPGEAPTVLKPIFEWDGRELTVRYLRFWIEAGHEKIGLPLTGEQKRALDVLDATLRQPGLYVEFGLNRGDIWVMNNRWILHNRTAFEDFEEEARRRHLVRLWLKTKSAREPVHAG